MYSEILKAMRGDLNLADLGAVVRSIRRTHTGKMNLALKRDTARRVRPTKNLPNKSWEREWRCAPSPRKCEIFTDL